MLHNYRALLAGLALLSAAATADAGVVISQVYGGGGNSGATFKNDFIELFNNGTTAVNLSGWSVQYGSATNVIWTGVTVLPNFSLQPGQYFLIQQAAGTGAAPALPTPDATGSINMSGTAGRVALVQNGTALANGCPANGDPTVADLVGFGSGAAMCAETTAVGTLSNSTSAQRNSNGCTDTGSNVADFTVATPVPRNTGTTINLCTSGAILSIGDANVAEGVTGATTPLTFTVSLAAPATSAVTFDIATADGTANAASGDYVARSLTGQTIALGQQTYTFDVTVNGDTTVEPNETFSVTVSNISGGGVVTTSAVATGTINSDEDVEIWQIQGNTDVSPFAGQTVWTHANIVTAIGTEGFFMQTPSARSDGDMNTSDGIYVFLGAAPQSLVVGQLVSVGGQVTEFFGMTEFTNNPSVTGLAESGPVPPAVVFDNVLPSPDPNTPSCVGSGGYKSHFECFEGMRVTVANGMANAGNQSFGGGSCVTTPSATSDCTAEFYATASGQRALREPGIAFPGLPGLPVWDGNPELFEVDVNRLTRPISTSDNAAPDDPVINGGTTFSATGVIGFDFGGYELWPTSFQVIQATTLPLPATATEPGVLSIASQNTLHLFDSINDPGDDDVLTPADAERKLRKLCNQIRQGFGTPGVVALQEVEKLSVLQALADKLSQTGGADPNCPGTPVQYAPYLFEGNDIGGIDNALLVRSDITVASVVQLGAAEEWTFNSVVDLLHDRPTLLLRATYNGLDFAVMVLHTKSLIGVDDAAAGPRNRAKRLRQAQSIAQSIQDFQVANPSVPLVVVGDLNAFEFTDGYVDVVGQLKGVVDPSANMLSEPVITNPPLYDATLSMPAAQRYSYNFGGSAQALDHALLSQSALPYFSRMSFARANVDAPVLAGLVPTDFSPLRNSDHEGFVVQLVIDRIFADDFESAP